MARCSVVEILQALSRAPSSDARRSSGQILRRCGPRGISRTHEMAVRAAAVLSKEFTVNSQRRQVAHTICASVFILRCCAWTPMAISTAMASMRRRESKQRSIPARYRHSARTSGVKSVDAKDSVSSRSVIGISRASVQLIFTVVTLGRKASQRRRKKSSQPGERRKEGIRSIAVLPFADLSAERDQEHFSDGVAEEILNALSKVSRSPRSGQNIMFCISWSHPDAREIGKRLGVETLLDGSIRKAESVSGSACNSLTPVMGINSGRNGSIARLKTSLQSRMRSPEAFWNR